MKQAIALKSTLGISVIGILFSGYLSYTELFAGACATGTCSTVITVPACVYGFFMYLAVFIISLLGLKNSIG